MKVLVINAGSSSLKYQLLDTESGEVMAKGLCERIGIDGVLTHTGNKSDEKFKFDIAMPTHKEAIQSVINVLLDPEKGVISSMSEIDAVGHRVVHGGEFFTDSVIITEKVLKAIEDCVPLAPLHNPPNLIGIQACREVMGPDVPMVAVFDTAFHQTMPQSHYMYAIPYEYYEKYKIRRYGFHGTSHKYVSQQAAEMLGRPLEELRLITCHLGNGSSICAINRGKSFDTSMGFTPLDGLPMGTRAGNIDPAIIEFLSEHENISAAEVINILNKKSGMLGISGVSSDFRDLDAAIPTAMRARRWPRICSTCRSRRSSARTSRRWAAWTPSSSPRASARTTARSAGTFASTWSIWASRSTRRRTSTAASRWIFPSTGRACACWSSPPMRN